MPSAATGRRSNGSRGSRAKTPTLSLVDQVCLALVVEGVSYGWALGTLLAPEGELAGFGSRARPVVYRAIDELVEDALVTRRIYKTGHGRRSRLACPNRQRPPDQPPLAGCPRSSTSRDVRAELLMKLTLRERAGLETRTLLTA